MITLSQSAPDAVKGPFQCYLIAGQKPSPTIRSPSCERPERTDLQVRKVEEIRADIDRCDEKLLSAFIERVRLVREVARSKAKAGRPVLDAERERAMLDRAQLLGPNTRTFMNQILALCRVEIYDELEPKERTHGNTT